MNFRVWSPTANSIELLSDAETFPMSRGAGDWWSVDAPLASGCEYRFRVDGNGPFPDPRSPWQPAGVHGPSVAIDHSTFDWSDAGWIPKPLSEAVIYELHIGTFTPEGTCAAAAEKLPYLRDLGITHIEVMPLAAFPGERGWGYDGVSLYAPHSAYGTPDDLKAFVQAAHDHGLAVLLDVVYNHLGPDGNYTGAFGPYFTNHVNTPWGDAVNFFEAYSDGVRQFFIDNALMWLRDYHFDGLRLDAVHAIFDESALHFLEELAERVGELEALLARPLVLIAESDRNDPRYVHPHARGGYGLDAHWMDDFHHALHAFFTGERDGYYADFGRLADIAKACRQGYVFDGQYSPYRKRRHGRPPIGIHPNQLVVCSQNHDQIGNRAYGERLSQLVNLDALKAIAALTVLSPYVPLLFQGEEWGASTPFQYFTDHIDQALGHAVTEGRRTEFSKFSWAGEIPDPQDRATFERSKLDWNEMREDRHADLLAWYKALLTIRRELANDGATPPQVAFDESARWLTMQRNSLILAFNFSGRPLAIPLPPGDWKIRLSNPAGVPLESEIPAHSTVIASC